MGFDLKVGFSCNNNCIHCVVTDKLEKTKSKDLTYDEIISLIDNNDEHETFIITGGEPTKRDDFINIIKYLHEKNKAVYLQTNGMMLDDLELAKEASKYIDHYLIALHSYKKDVHDEITTLTGSWDRTTQAIVNLINLDQIEKMTSQTVISRINMPTLKETYDFLYQVGFRKMNLTFPHCMGNAMKNIKEVQPKYSELEEILGYILSKYDKFVMTEMIPMCYLYQYKHNSIAYLQNSITGGDRERTKGYDQYVAETIRNDEQVDGVDCNKIIDYNEILKRDFVKTEVCDDCAFYSKCDGVWVEYYNMYKDEMDLKPVQLAEIYLAWDQYEFERYGGDDNK